MTLFPKSTLTLDKVAETMTKFQDQLQYIHWRTKSYAEHKAIGELYNKVGSIKDDLVEKIMGYTKSVPAVPTTITLTSANAYDVCSYIEAFSKQLKEWAESQKFLDISNIADELSGEAAKTLYLLTLS